MKTGSRPVEPWRRIDRHRIRPARPEWRRELLRAGPPHRSAPQPCSPAATGVAHGAGHSGPAPDPGHQARVRERPFLPSRRVTVFPLVRHPAGRPRRGDGYRCHPCCWSSPRRSRGDQVAAIGFRGSSPSFAKRPLVASFTLHDHWGDRQVARLRRDDPLPRGFRRPQGEGSAWRRASAERLSS
jgi:hypothetical protein